MTWVKVCGLTRESDVADAVDAGADALGFVLAAESPRRISKERAADLMDGVPALRILVTVDAPLEM
ncbi:MAG: N-(5'-phosphoribosyl)anthranilate isomerase, partial [Actinomycetota bacterium]|nr:N-(5'-phosphoribosyl)anthranilate isomerase [Actinomycetota bacterium]